MCSARLLHNGEEIDQMFETQFTLACATARQWFGHSGVAAALADRWWCEGLSRLMAARVLQQRYLNSVCIVHSSLYIFLLFLNYFSLGKNEYEWLFAVQLERLWHAQPLHKQPPLYWTDALTGEDILNNQWWQVILYHVGFAFPLFSPFFLYFFFLSPLSFSLFIFMEHSYVQC